LSFPGTAIALSATLIVFFDTRERKLGAGFIGYLLIHGTKDDKVPFEQSLLFQEKMKAAGNTCDLIAIPGGTHGMGGWEKLDPGYKDKLVAWLRDKLAARQ